MNLFSAAVDQTPCMNNSLQQCAEHCQRHVIDHHFAFKRLSHLVREHRLEDGRASRKNRLVRANPLASAKQHDIAVQFSVKQLGVCLQHVLLELARTVEQAVVLRRPKHSQLDFEGDCVIEHEAV